MRPYVLILAGLALAAPASPAHAQDGYEHGYIHGLEPGVTVQRATEVAAETAVPNLPFLPGDRVWTDDTGRADFRFPDGSAVRLDRRSKLDYSSDEQGQEETIVLRLWSGSLILHDRSGRLASFEIETPSGLVRVADRAVLRVDVVGGETWLSAYEGEATLDDGRERVELRAGERISAPWGGEPAAPEPFDRYASDDFARWDADLEAQTAYAANSERYLPPALDPYAADLDAAGSWVYAPTAGYVWRPRVAAGWAPYTNGYWAWTPPYGYTWVDYDPWGWAPFHYGRWGFSISLGWYWTPGTVWGPGWVSWWVGGGHVAWCPLGRHDRPVGPWPRYGGHAVPRGAGHAGSRAALADGWRMIPRADLGRRDAARRQVRVDPEHLSGGHFALGVHERPTRGGLGLAATVAVPRGVAVRPRPGAAGRTLPTSPGRLRPYSETGRTRSSAPAATGSGRTRGTGTAAPATHVPERTDSGIAGRRPRPGVGSGVRSTEPSRRPAETRRPPAFLSNPRDHERAGTSRAPSSSAGASTPRAQPRSSRPFVGSETRPGVSRSPWSSGSRPGMSRPSSGSTRPSGASSSRSGASSRRGTSSHPGASSRPGASSSRAGAASRSRPGASRSSASRSGSGHSGGSRAGARARPRPRER
jgi:hypothetical protein